MKKQLTLAKPGRGPAAGVAVGGDDDG